MTHNTKHKARALEKRKNIRDKGKYQYRNGLISRVGFTNGREQTQGILWRKDKRIHFPTFVFLVFIAFSLLFTGNFYLKNQEGKIKIDGIFDDWTSIKKVTDKRNYSLPEDIDIKEYASCTEGQNQYFYIAVYGKLFNKYDSSDVHSHATGTVGEYVNFEWKIPNTDGKNVVYIFIDSDMNSTTGYKLADNIGIDYAVEITGKCGQIYSSNFLEFAGTASDAWLWKIAKKVPSAMCENAIELMLQKPGFEISKSIIIYYIVSWDNQEDCSTPDITVINKRNDQVMVLRDASELSYFLENAYFVDISNKLGLHMGENNNRTFLYPMRSNGSAWVYSLTDQNGVLLTYPHVYDGTNITNITALVMDAISPQTPGEVYGVGWNGTHWLIGGTCRDGEGYPYLVSFDGTDVSNINLTNSPFGRFTWSAICSAVWNGTHWLVADTMHTLALYDGITFTNLTPQLEAMGWSMPTSWTREQHMSIGWNGTHWLIMVGNTSNNATSYKPANIALWDGGNNWTDLTSQLNLPVWDIGTYRVAWNGNFWLFGTAESSWDNYGIPSPPGSQIIKFDGNSFTMLGNLFANSTDISDIEWNGNYFMIVGWNHTRNVTGLSNYTETQVYVWDGVNSPVEITEKIEENVGYVAAQYALSGGFCGCAKNNTCWMIGGIKSQYPHIYHISSLLETNVSEELALTTEMAEDIDGGYIVNWTWNISGMLKYGSAVLNFSEPGVYPCTLTTRDNDNQTFSKNFTLVVHGGWLNGSVSPEDAVIYVDGMQINVTNGMFNVSLKPGYHTVNATRAGYEAYEQTVYISDSTETNIQITLTPVVEMRAEIFIGIFMLLRVIILRNHQSLRISRR